MSIVNKEQLLEYMHEPDYRPMTAEQLARELKVDRTAKFMALLHRLEKKGQIVVTRKGRYALPDQVHYITGRLQGHPRGFGFVLPEVSGDKPASEPVRDIYIRPEDLNGAMHQDRVQVRVRGTTEKGHPEGEIIRILERGSRRLVGTYQRHGRLGIVVPDEARINWDVYVSREDAGMARSGDKVVVELTRWPEQRRNPEGRVVEVLGAKGSPGVDVLSIIRKYDLPEEFPKKVLREVQWVPTTVRPEDLEGRYDLRHLSIVTIDGADAKDLDDAVSIEILPNGHYLLGVHIADVAYYVRSGSPVDVEAMHRGTSVYLVDRVIPMLPPELSNGICSLNPQVDRLTLSVFMELDETGERTAYSIFPSVIRTVERMTYTAVRQILVDKDPAMLERYHNLVEDFRRMEQLAKILRERRVDRGALDFDLPECKVGLDDDGRPIDLYRYPRSIADEIIEEFMLAANETVAWHLHIQELPGMYRVHEEPESDKLEEMNRSLQALGYTLPRLGKIHTRVFQQLLKRVEGRREERVINTLLLRSMRHARYDPTPLGHFGLAVKYYTHFTSPIRRYPDLIVHRILQASLPAEGFFFPSAWRPRPDLNQVRVEMEAVGNKQSATDLGIRANDSDYYVSNSKGRLTVKGRKKAAGAENLNWEIAAENSTPSRKEVLNRLAPMLPQIADEASERERKAEEAERESVDMKKVEYMLQHVGEIFPGIVSGVTPFGMFVELENLVEGLVHVASIEDDYYIYVDSPPSLIGERTRRQFRIGDEVEVEVVRVSVEQRQVDFELV